jgi:hypothetical protein
MGQITNEMVRDVYQIGKQVFSGSIGRFDASCLAAKRTGMDRGSAQDYITVLLAMLDGKCYKRTINKYATAYYLDSIGSDFGEGKQREAASAVLEHVKYYSEKHGYLRSIEEIAKKYIQ